jgi:hypothetical protein
MPTGRHPRGFGYMPTRHEVNKERNANLCGTFSGPLGLTFGTHASPVERRCSCVAL